MSKGHTFVGWCFQLLCCFPMGDQGDRSAYLIWYGLLHQRHFPETTLPLIQAWRYEYINPWGWVCVSSQSQNQDLSHVNVLTSTLYTTRTCSCIFPPPQKKKNYTQAMFMHQLNNFLNGYRGNPDILKIPNWRHTVRLFFCACWFIYIGLLCFVACQNNIITISSNVSTAHTDRCQRKTNGNFITVLMCFIISCGGRPERLNSSFPKDISSIDMFVMEIGSVVCDESHHFHTHHICDPLMPYGLSSWKGPLQSGQKCLITG